MVVTAARSAPAIPAPHQTSGRTEDALPRHAALRERGADRLLVPVRLGVVEVRVAGRQRLNDRVDELVVDSGFVGFGPVPGGS